MDRKSEGIIRGIFIFVSFLFFGFGFYLIYNIVYGFYEKIINGLFFSEINFSLVVPILCFIFGFVLYKIGRHWDNVFKSFTKSFVGFALFFLIFSILLFSINNNADEIVSSVQPTIDYMVVNSIDDIIDKTFQVVDFQINVVVSEDIIVEEFYVSNLTLTQAEFLSDVFASGLKGNDAKSFASIMITLVYGELVKVGSQALDVPIPVFELKRVVGEQVGDDVFANVDVSLLEGVFSINENAYLNLLLSNDSQVISVNPSDLSFDEVDLIWDNFGLEGEVSPDLKRKIVAGILSFSIQELDKNDLNNLNRMPEVRVSIPISSLSYLLPEEMKNLVKSGIFSGNISKRAEALKYSRVNCEVGVKDISNSFSEMFCNSILITKYENLISILSGNSELDVQGLNEISTSGFNMSEILLDYRTIDDVEVKIKEMSSKWFKYFYLFLFFMILAFIFYFLHFYLFKRELVVEHLPYYLAKLNLFDYLSSFILLSIVFFIFKSKFLIIFISNFLSNFSLTFSSDFFMNLPIYSIILKINFEFFILALVYLLFSILAYGMFYFILKHKLK